MTLKRLDSAALDVFSSKPEDHEATRTRLRTMLGSTAIDSLSISELDEIQITPVSRLGDDIIIFPAEWMPAGRYRIPAYREIRVSTMASIQHPIASSGYIAARQSVLRNLLSLWLLPVHLGRGHGIKLLKPSTYCMRAKALLYLARLLLTSTEISILEGGLFRNLTQRQIVKFVGEARSAYAAHMIGVIGHLDQLRDRGAIADWLPPTHSMSVVRTANDWVIPERPRQGEGHLTSDVDTQAVWQPLPDAFVSQQGWRSLWLMENLGPTVLGFAEQLAAEGLLESMVNHASLSPAVVWRARKVAMDGYNWHDANGDPLVQLPFALNIKASRSSISTFSAWPPPTYHQLMQCMTVLEGVHLFIVLMATGARWSEVASLTRNCLRPGEGQDGKIIRMEGQTYKLVERVGGADRDWPLHPLAAIAIEQQVRLSKILAPNLNNLWVIKSKNSRSREWEGRNTANDMLVRLSIATGTQDLLAGTSLHSHRFRKTIARLAALTLVGAPKILMDLFGHRSIEMTLRYILSDPAVAAEVQEVSKAMVVMLGEEAIKNASGNGGPAGDRVREYLRTRVALNGGRTLGTDNLIEAAEILTGNGKAAALVRPGILCLKQPGQAGPCTQRVGHPDPSRCRLTCDFRLDLSAAKQDAIDVVEQAIEALRTKSVQEDSMMWAFWQGQISAQLKRFSDLGPRFSKDLEDIGVQCEASL